MNDRKQKKLLRWVAKYIFEAVKPPADLLYYEGEMQDAASEWMAYLLDMSQRKLDDSQTHFSAQDIELAIQIHHARKVIMYYNNWLNKGVENNLIGEAVKLPVPAQVKEPGSIHSPGQRKFAIEAAERQYKMTGKVVMSQHDHDHGEARIDGYLFGTPDEFDVFAAEQGYMVEVRT